MSSSMQLKGQPHLSSRRQTSQVGDRLTSIPKSDNKLWQTRQQLDRSFEFPSLTGAKRPRDETEERPCKRMCADPSSVEQCGPLFQYGMLPIGTALSASNYEPSYFFTHASQIDQAPREIVTVCPSEMTVPRIQSLPDLVSAQLKTDVASDHSAVTVDTFDADMAFLQSLSTERFRELMEIVQENEEMSSTLESSKVPCASQPPIQTVVADDDSSVFEEPFEEESASTCDSLPTVSLQLSTSPPPEASFDKRYAEAIKYWTGAPFNFTLRRM